MKYIGLTIFLFAILIFGATQLLVELTLSIVVILITLGYSLYRLYFRDCIFLSYLNYLRNDKYQYRSLILFCIFTIYILISLFNYRAEFNLDTNTITYRDNINYLPTTYDKTRTIYSLFSFISLFLYFHCIRYSIYREYKKCKSNIVHNKYFDFVFIVVALLAIVAIVQKLYYTDYSNGKLLFLITPRFNSDPNLHYGPFAYRSNGAMIANLVWPFMIYRLSVFKDYRSANFTKSPVILLIPILLIVLLSIVFCLSRLALLTLFFQSFLLIILLKNNNSRSILLISSILIGIIVFNYAPLIERFFNDLGGVLSNKSAFIATLFSRMEKIKITINMLSDYSFLGVGAGAYETIFQFESTDNYQVWESYAHCDPLEYLLTLGLPGFLLLILILYNLALKPIYNNYDFNIRSTYFIVFMGLLINSALDFPFQVYSIKIVFILLTALVIPFPKIRTLK